MERLSETDEVYKKEKRVLEAVKKGLQLQIVRFKWTAQRTLLCSRRTENRQDRIPPRGRRVVHGLSTANNAYSVLSANWLDSRYTRRTFFSQQSFKIILAGKKKQAHSVALDVITVWTRSLPCHSYCY